MIIWTAEFDDVQNYFELWMRRVLAGDRIIVTVGGEPTAAIVPYEDYQRWLKLEARQTWATDTTTLAT